MAFQKQPTYNYSALLLHHHSSFSHYNLLVTAHCALLHPVDKTSTNTTALLSSVGTSVVRATLPSTIVLFSLCGHVCHKLLLLGSELVGAQLTVFFFSFFALLILNFHGCYVGVYGGHFFSAGHALDRRHVAGDIVLGMWPMFLLACNSFRIRLWKDEINPFTATGYFDIPLPRWPTFLAMLFPILKDGMGLSLSDEFEVQYHVIKK